jgi:UDP-glucose 4-epimerase
VSAERSQARVVLITGASGAVGRGVVEALAKPSGESGRVEKVIALDVRVAPANERLAGVTYATVDVRDAAAVRGAIATHGVDTVVHLAAIVTPGPGMSREAMHAIDVGGTRNVLDACVAGGVARLIVASSGAAYGYYADNPPLLDESDALRGNAEFAYSDHKRLVEELLADYRTRHPELGQLVLRLCTVLGPRIDNQITAMFFRPQIVGVEGAPSPFVFVWDEDVVAAILAGVHRGATGVYNVAGDGVMTLREIAAALGRPYLALPAPLLSAAIAALQKRGKTSYGPEQVVFLQHRPVLGNARLKRELGLRPLSSREAFARYIALAQRRREEAGVASEGLANALSARLGRGDRVARLALGAAGWTIGALAPALTRLLGRV